MPNVCAHKRKKIIMTKIQNSTQRCAAIEYTAYFANEEYNSRERPINVFEAEIPNFLLNIEQLSGHNPIEKKEFSLLHSVFHGAPVFDGLVGPIYGVSFDRERVCLNYIEGKLLDVLDYDDDHLLEVRSEVEDLIRPLINGHSDDSRHGPLVIPDPLKQTLLENGQRQLSEYKRSGQRLDLKPVVKLYRADGAGTWLLSQMYEERPDVAIGLCDQGGGHTVTKAISLSDLEEHACIGLFNIELDESFVATKTIAEYAKEARDSGALIV
jgi:hypothetical protein